MIDEHQRSQPTGATATHSYPDSRLLIAGRWRDATGGRSLPVLNPATGQPIGRVAHASLSDVDEAVAAAVEGFEVWRALSAIARAGVMRRAAALLRERADAIAQVLTQEQGKPFAEARVETLAGADMIEWFADEGLRVYGRIVPSRSSAAVRQMVLKEPVGPVAAFTPWNFPINQIVRKVGAALATGCSMLIKGPEETPAAPAALVQAFVDAGLPPGVLGLVFGDPQEISSHLIAHPAIRKITFTGSTEVGKHLAAMAGAHMKRATMELGGHAPVIVAEDADLNLAVKMLTGAKFRNAGQVCISPTRFLVHRSLVSAFADGMAEAAGQLKVGDGLAEGIQMGPLANARRVTAMQHFTDDAVARGARLLAGGERLGSAGNFWSPTILADVPLDARMFNEEPFGPIAGIRAFDAIEEAVAEANRLSYGLAGYAFTRSLRTADVLTRSLEVGMLWINMPAVASAELPFGGMKDSGHGTEGGPEALDAYLNVRSVAITHV